MSLHLCMLFILNKHLYTFYIYMQYLSRGMLVVTLAAAPVVTLSVAKGLSPWAVRCFAELTLSGANVLSMTGGHSA